MRSKWKGPIITSAIFKKVISLNENIFYENFHKMKPFFIYQKSFTLLPKYKDLTFYIYNGHFKYKNKKKQKEPFQYKEIYLNHSIGEFVKTRKDHRYRSKKKKKKK